jgi:peroxiredoxin Q/BCP
LREDYTEFVQRGAEVLVVGTDDRKSFEYHWASQKYPFVGMPDPQCIVPDLYGQQVKLLKFGRMPALMVIDKAGIIRYAHYGDSMSDIPSDAQVLRLLDKINQEDQRVSGDVGM